MTIKKMIEAASFFLRFAVNVCLAVVATVNFLNS
jgi:hypothetical protein